MTAQVSETLIYQGQELMMCETPLDSYLIQKRIEFLSETTANWRGYKGTWEIKGSDEQGYRLYLVSLTANITGWKKVELDYLFPKYPEGVFAHWYSGRARCPRGKLLNYVHGGYASTYEEDLFFDFNEGVLQGTRLVKNEPHPPRNEDDYPPYLRRGA
jgi:hypothetical protein